MNLSSPVTALPGVGSVMAAKLAKLGITSIFDLLYHIPSRYEDRSQISSISLLQLGETVCIKGQLDFIKNEYTHRGHLVQKGQVSDSSGSVSLIWFNQSFLTRNLKPKSEVCLFGRVDSFKNNKTLISPEYETISDQHQLLHTGRLVPIYPETSGISSKWLRTKIYYLLSIIDSSEPFPVPTGLLPWFKALSLIHFPPDLDSVKPARHRLAFDEILLLQLQSLYRRSSWETTRLAHTFSIDQDQITRFIGTLPFTLTPSQTVAIQEILTDLSADKPMNRLLEGDVGSGKTVVAAIAAYLAHLNGYSSLFITPTQILATQHHQTLSSLFKPYGLDVGLITGSSKKYQRDRQLPFIVGTHALLTTKVDLGNVGLVVIDEQHRFGVLQRSLAGRLGNSPHILTMTATPIPRTIALTLMGDLDVSILANPPAGRLTVKTWLVPEAKRSSAYTWISQKITSTKSQLFIVCPFIETSESQTSVKAATAEYVRLQSVFSGFSIGLLHGKLTLAQKDQVLSDFRSGRIQILVSTPVVEVGIDVPNASIMLIETAERFGLAQLHQLRGRVGRNSRQAYCLLFANSDSARLKALENHHSGLELAEIDLRLRGPGQVFGTVQHGLPQFKIANYEDLQLIETAKQFAQSLLPKLSLYPALQNLFQTDKIGHIQPN